MRKLSPTLIALLVVILPASAGVSESLGGSAATLMAARGRHREAHRRFAETAACHARYRERILGLLSESRKLAFVQQQEAQLHRFLCHTARFMTGDPAAVGESFGAWLAWKGAVLDAQRRRFDAVDADAIAQLLPAGSAYLDYARIDDFDFTAGRSGGVRYLMFVLAPGAAEPLRLIDLGAAEPIDAAVDEYLARIRDQAPPGTLRRSAQSLHQQLLAPAGEILRSCRHLLISPDGTLHRLPFGSLQTPDGDYLVETLLVSYLASGRDLLSWLRPLTRSREAVVFADPDYDLDRTEGRERVGERAVGANGVRGGTGRNPGKPGLFKRLPGAREEGVAVGRILGQKLGANVTTYIADRALEEVLLSIRAPRVLHLATHGFFLADTPAAGPPEPDGVGKPLRSGIALAGANTSIAEGGHEGLVSAAKIVGLDVRGTELVVLSACSTARGDIRRGEGVFGLQRAFMVAGARSLLITRWQVEDEVIKKVMTEFYTGWATGLSKAEALRQAQLKLLGRYPHPYHWAATFLVGDGR